MYNQIIKNLFLGSLEDALEFEKEKRPIIRDHQNWLVIDKD